MLQDLIFPWNYEEQHRYVKRCQGGAGFFDRLSFDTKDGDPLTFKDGKRLPGGRPDVRLA